MRNHNKLRAFELADEIVLLTYKITKDFPKAESYGLSAQMRRAAVSIPSNIVEGCARESLGEYLIPVVTNMFRFKSTVKEYPYFLGWTYHNESDSLA